MAQAFAIAFYNSKQWKRMRAYIYSRDNGVCVKCGACGEIVHHKEHLTPENISDLEIALGEDNLELVCRNCHELEHPGEPITAEGLCFNEYGDLIERDDSYAKGYGSA